jgi:hypothetical protein
MVSFERRTPVQPQPAFTLRITSGAPPLLLKLKTCFTSDPGLMRPKSYSSSLNAISGYFLHDESETHDESIITENRQNNRIFFMGIPFS